MHLGAMDFLHPQKRGGYMRSAKRLAWMVVACVVAASAPITAMAQVNGVHLTVFPWYGYANFAKNVNFDDKTIYGGSLGLNFHRYVGIEGHLGRTSPPTVLGPTLYTPTPPFGAGSFDVDILHYGGNLVVNLRPSAWFSPYLMAGWQEAKFDYANKDTVPKARYLNGWEYGAGVKLHIAPRVAIRAEFRNALWKFREGVVPAAVAGKDATDNQFYTAGIEFSLGGKTGPSGVKDADNDGVPDRKDKCPDTPAGATVDLNGCPFDSDKDGVYDGIDQCPNTPTGATVDARGCPSDADNDGVPDGIDQCADTPAGTVVDARGCPKIIDSDNDGVPDDKDLCPFTPANVRVDKDGCPIELSEKETELLDKGRITERNIHFETAKWDILPESIPVMDEIGNILIQWPRLRIEIGGHADWRGSDAYNLDLSNKRANAVLEYLVGKFPQITREQYSAKGYGESVPVATNKTVEGMAQNRRVEFKVLNTEELKKERERRRTLQKGE
jgi:outer membrane protein OmpA-like peptidoglycan-associated protein/opacity protein-like surface antigen